jgi:hypothetical protein
VVLQALTEPLLEHVSPPLFGRESLFKLSFLRCCEIFSMRQPLLEADDPTVNFIDVFDYRRTRFCFLRLVHCRFIPPTATGLGRLMATVNATNRGLASNRLLDFDLTVAGPGPFTGRGSGLLLAQGQGTRCWAVQGGLCAPGRVLGCQSLDPQPS